MDIKMPGMNGIDATRHIDEISPDIGVLVITMFDDDDSVLAAMRAGARDYLLKDADKENWYGQLSPWKKAKRSSVPPSPNA
jgi:DNA-binding NarL/FixJ family response regulator